MPLIATLLSSYWKHLFVFIMATIYSTYVWNAGATHEHSKWASREAVIRNEAQEACNNQKAITEKANADLQNSRDRIAADLNRYKRLHPLSCIAPAKHSGIQHGWAEHATGNGTVAGTSDDFREYAAKCESYRSEALACQAFIQAERK